MAVTPFLRPFNKDGGTLYVFPSASVDLTKTFVSNDYEFMFSHFACLNLPDIHIEDDNNQSTEKGLYLKRLYYVGDDTDKHVILSSNGGMEHAITEEFQNYIMNFETAILNGEGDNDDYDSDIMTTVSEKLFFTWLEKIGGIEFNGNIEKYNKLKERTVQYIGNIDVMNTVEVNGDTFEELYIHIPSTVGASSKVLFKKGEETDNKNFIAGMTYNLGSVNDDLDVSNPSELIIGRTCENPYDSSISNEAIYDFDQGKNKYTTFYEDKDGNRINCEGYTINFSDTVYADGDGISTMNSESSESFEFNAILIYYDFVKKNDSTKYTNLYGILFLDNVTDLSDNTGNQKDGYFQRYPKIKSTTYGGGNSFSLKVDLKIDTIPDTASDVRIYYDPNDVVAMALYEKSLVQLQNCIDTFYTIKTQFASIEQRLSSLETMVTGIDNINDLQSRVDRLYNLYDGMTTVDTASLLSLIESNTKKLNSIMKGEKNIQLQYDTDVIQGGNGITVNRDGVNKVSISSNQKYSIVGVYNDSEKTSEITTETPMTTDKVSDEFYLSLKTGTNIAVINYKDEGYLFKDIVINIDAKEFPWQVGQSLKICFIGEAMTDRINFGDSGCGIIIKPTEDVKSDKLGSLSTNDIKEIEVVCTGDKKFIYMVD